MTFVRDLASNLIPNERPMRAHKFQVGQFVRIAPRASWAVPPGRYEVVRQMPADGGGNQYRVKFVDNGHERVVKESDLS